VSSLEEHTVKGEERKKEVDIVKNVLRYTDYKKHEGKDGLHHVTPMRERWASPI